MLVKRTQSLNKRHQKHQQVDLIHAFLIARGYSGKELEYQYQLLKKQGVTVDKLIKDFITTADRDPKCLNEMKRGNKTCCCGCVNRDKV